MPRTFKRARPWAVLMAVATAVGTLAVSPVGAVGAAGGPIVVEPEGVRLPAPPEPENITLERGPLPPAPIAGECSLDANPQVTGCVTSINRVGGFFDDNNLVASVTFAGAPASGPGSVYTGTQLIAINVDGELFSNGSPWKCLTCAIPAENRFGGGYSSVDGLQPFPDGKRVLYAHNILECEESLLSDDCTPESTHTYPIRWNTSPDGSGSGGSMREPRLHPDGVHLGWSSFVISSTKLDQFMYYGRLEFNPSPTSGTPATPRYDLSNVSLIQDPDDPGVLQVDPENPGEVLHNPLTPEVGEFRAWSRDGEWAAYVGYPTEANRIDMFRVHMQTGEVQRLTRHAEYTDPVGYSHDGQWGLYADTRGSGRQMFVGGMPGLPPLNDLITTSFVSSTRNDGNRRFFQPILIDIHGDRGDYEGQRLNTCNGDPGRTGEPGDLCDMDWNILADPNWSLDDTKIAYREAVVTGTSVEDGGRRTRLIIARLVDREPVDYAVPAVAPDEVPWAQVYTPGDAPPFRSSLVPDEGRFILRGRFGGHAEVTIEHAGGGTVVGYVAVSYHDFSQDGINVINGTEAVRRLTTTPFVPHLLWHSDLSLSGERTGTKVTSEGGLRATINLFQNVLSTSGSLTTTLDGIVHNQPASQPLAPTALAPMVNPATPANTTVLLGSTAELTVTAVAGDQPTSYQWYQGTWPDTSKPVGDNSPTFTTPSVTGPTSYWVRVSNDTGSVDSRTAQVTATPGSRADCRGTGWQNLSDGSGRPFRNQGECVGYVASGGSGPGR